MKGTTAPQSAGPTHPHNCMPAARPGGSLACTFKRTGSRSSSIHQLNRQQPQPQQPGGTAVWPAAATGAANIATGTSGTAPAAGLQGQLDEAAEALLQQLVHSGAEVNVAVRRLPGVGRAVLAPTSIKQGDVLVRLPLEMTYVADDSQGAEVTARELLSDMVQQDHPLAPYFRALPDPSEVFSAINMPKSYIPIIQDDTTEFAVRLLQAQADEEWSRHSADFWQSLGPGMTVNNLTYAMSLAWTRRFGLGGHSRFIPVVDLANHLNGCKHTIGLEPCQATPALKQWAQRLPPAALAKVLDTPCQCSREGAAAGSGSSAAAVGSRCVVWRAGEDLRAGQEVCNGYHAAMLQDTALLQYGFLQEGPVASELSRMDRADRPPGVLNAWTSPRPEPGSSLPPRFTGSPEQLQAEVDRLTQRLGQLSAGEAKVTAVRVDAAADPQGRFLGRMLEWRRQRMSALQAEVERLRGLLLGGSGGQGSRMPGGVAVS